MGTRLQRFDPQPCVYVGTLEHDTIIPLCVYRGAAGAMRKLSVMVSVTYFEVTPSSNFWTFAVESRNNMDSTVTIGNGTLCTSTGVLRGGIWTDIVDRVRMQDDQTVQISIKKTGNPMPLAGLAFSWVKEIA